MAVGDYEVWEDRFKALMQEIRDEADRADRYKFNSNIDAYHRKTIKELRELLFCLGKFADYQFNIFYKFFNNGTPANWHSLKSFPPEYVLRATLEQVGFDLFVISEAINQRADSANGALLKRADFLSQKALEPAQKGANPVIDPGMRVICYMMKSPSVRVIPYANTALVGIPQTVGMVSRDFLAIPHEVGHIVYWLGRVSEGGQKKFISSILQKSAPGRDDKKNDSKNFSAYRWLEEIFADVYGALIAGPAIALGFQDLHLSATQAEFFEDDLDHPPPILRPNIYNQILKEAGFPKLAKALHKRWNGTKQGDDYVGGVINTRLKRDKKKEADGTEVVVANHGHQFGRRNRSSEDDKKVNVKDVMTIEPDEGWQETKKIDKLVKFLFNKIHGGPADQAWMNFDGSWWREGLDDNAHEITDIFTVFDTEIDKLVPGDQGYSAEIDKIFGKNLIPWPDNKLASDDRYNNLKQRWIAEGKEVNPAHEAKFDWFLVFQSNGWTTEAPHSNPPDPP